MFNLGEQNLNKSETGDSDIIHLREEKIVRSNKISLLFFNPNFKEKWDKKYIDIIKSDKPIRLYRDSFVYTIKLNQEIELKIIKSSIKTDNPHKIELDLSRKRFMMTPSFKKFLKFYKLPIDIPQNHPNVISILKTHEICFKKIQTPIDIWNINNSIDNDNYVVILFIGDKPVGICISEIIKHKELEDLVKEKEIPDKNYNLYIARVDIHPEFQGLGLCKPLVSYMIKQLKILGYNFLFINNASQTNQGIPACICYIKSGTDNQYKLKYKNHKISDFKNMDVAYCLSHKSIPRDYYYNL